MHKASKLAKGGVVLGLSMATFIAYAGTAFAATTPAGNGAITITPPAGGTTTNTSPAPDSCLVYTATQTGATGGYLDVSVNSTSGNAQFCAPTGTTEPVAPPPTATERVNVNGNGQITFGVTDTSAESVSIQVWDDNVTADDKFTGGEPNALSSATFVNAQGNSAVKSLSVQATSVKARPGDNVHFVVTALNNNSAVPVAQQGVSGATVNFVVTGPDAQGPSPCQGNPTGSDGSVYCPVRLTGAATASGTDTVTFFVNNAVNSGPGVDAGDSQTTATINNIGKAPAGDTVAAFCEQNSISSGRTCTDTIDTTNPNVNNTINEDFEFDILDPGTNPAFICCGSNPSSHTGDTGADTFITYSMTGASSAATLSSTTNDCETNDFVENGQGACETDVTVTEPNPTVGEVITVTGTLTGTTISANSTLTLQASPETARHITLTPPSQNVVVGQTGVLMATVTDTKGNPVAGVDVDFTSTGQGAFTSGCIFSATCVSESSTGGPIGLPETNAKGQIQVQVSSNTTGNQAISATIDPGDDTQCGDPAGFVNGLPVAGIEAGNCSATAAVKYITAPKPRTISETPHLSGHKSGHSLHLTATTHPTLRHKSVHFYRVKNGILHLIGAASSGSTGKAHLTLRHLKKGHYNIVARVVHAGANVVSHRSNHKHFTIS